MSIKTSGQLQGEDLKTAPTTAGLVKNDAAGNFLFGQTGSAWVLIETKVLAAAATNISFTGLLGGDISELAYRLVWENPFDAGTPTITDGRIFFRRNSVLTPDTTNISCVSSNLIGNAAGLSFTNHIGDLLISNMIVPSGAVPFLNSGIFQYTIKNVKNLSETTSGKVSYSREVNSYPSVPQIDGRWMGGRDRNLGSSLTSIGVTAAQTDMLRPGSVWSLYKIDSTP